MNTATITGTVSSVPTFKHRGFVPTTDFDVTVAVGRRRHTLHVQALNDQAKVARRYVIGDHVAVTGYLNSEAFDMPDRSVWQRVKIVAYEIDHRAGTRHRTARRRAMIADPATVVLTAHVAHWADDDPARTAWILHCLHRHNTSDWGDLDQHDAAANDHALAATLRAAAVELPGPARAHRPGRRRRPTLDHHRRPHRPRHHDPLAQRLLTRIHIRRLERPARRVGRSFAFRAPSRLDDALQLVQRLAHVTERRRQIGQHGSHRLALDRHRDARLDQFGHVRLTQRRHRVRPPQPLDLVLRQHHADHRVIEHMFATPTLDKTSEPQTARSIHRLLPGGCTRLPRTWVCSQSPSSASAKRPTTCPVSPNRLGDYYSGAGEAHGQWIGGGASRLGLDGQVDPDDLRAVLAGLRPGTGGLTPNGDTLRPHPRRVPGFDLTFKAPKSASVLYAVSDDPRVQGAVVEAGEAAMRVAIGYLEREAVRVQRGSHNLAYLARLDDHDRQVAGPRRLATSGVVAASFRHRTSRAGDPLLHWHVLVANVVEGTDGKWSSLVHPEIYRHARAAGEVFQAVYRDELTRRLGVEWRPGRARPRDRRHPPTRPGRVLQTLPRSRGLAGSDRHPQHDRRTPSSGVGDPAQQART